MAEQSVPDGVRELIDGVITKELVEAFEDAETLARVRHARAGLRGWDLRLAEVRDAIAAIAPHFVAAGRAQAAADIRARLDALAAAGRLLPEGAETQWGLRRHDRESVAPYASREVAERWQGVSQPGWHLVSRPVGPWSAVPPEPKEGAGGQPSPA